MQLDIPTFRPLVGRGTYGELVGVDATLKQKIISLRYKLVFITHMPAIFIIGMC
jgi:hypothetical protein